MSSYSIGTVWLQVATSFDGVQQGMKRHVKQGTDAAAKEATRALGQIENEAEQTGGRAGKKYGSAFEREMKTRVGRMQESIADIVGGDGIKTRIAHTKRLLDDLATSSYKTDRERADAANKLLDVHKTVNQILNENDTGARKLSSQTVANLAALSRQLGETKREMNKWGATDPRTGKNLAAQQLKDQETLQRSGVKQVAAAREMNAELDKRAQKEQAAGRVQLMAERDMAREFGNRAEATQRLGQMQERAAREMEAEFNRRADSHMEAIANEEAATRKSYKQQADARRAMDREFEDRAKPYLDDRNEQVVDKLNAVAGRAKEDGRLRVGVDIDEADAIAQVTRTRVEMEAVLAEAIDMGIDVDKLSAARSARAAMQVAEDSIEGQVLRIRAEVDKSRALAQAQALRSEIAALGDDIKYNADIDTATATAKIQRLKASLRSISGSVNVNGDILRLEALERELSRVDRQSARTRAGLGSIGAGGAANATRVFSGALLAVVSVGPLLIPVLGVIATGILGVGTAALGAVAGVGVLIAALSGIGGAVKAMSELQKAKRTAPGGKKKASADNERQAITDARALADAQKALQKAQTAAGDAMVAAGQKIVDAENAVAKAQKAALASQLAVNEARAQAVRDLEDLNNQLASARLQEQASAFSVEEANVHLNVVLEDDQSTDREKAVAQLAYDQAVQNQKEQSLSLKRLEVDAAKANTAGVEGAENVVAAKQGIVDANEAIVEAEKNLTEAHKDYATTQTEQAERVADAQLALARTIEDQGLRAAAAADGTDSLATATNNLNEAMRNLSPAGKRFAEFLFGLAPLLRDVRFAAQEGFLPGLQEAIQVIVDKYAPGFITFVGAMAEVMGDLAVKAAEALTGPFWSQFFDFMAVQSPIFLELFAEILGSLITFIAGITQAFAPLSLDIMTTLAAGAAAIAGWAIGLKDSPAFKAFMDYMVEIAPLVGALFQNLFIIIGKLLEGLAPYSEQLLTVFVAITGWLASLDPSTLANIAIGFIAIVGAIQAIAGLLSVVAGVAGLFTAGTAAVIAGAVVVAVVLLIGAITYLWTTSEKFRDFVKAAWKVIKDAILGPIGDILVALLGVPMTFIYLLATSEDFRDGVVSTIRSLADGVVDAFWIVVDVLQTVGQAFVDLYDAWIRPIVEVIIAQIGFLWAMFSLAWTMINLLFIQPLISAFTWIWKEVIEPIFGLIVDVITAVLIPVITGLWTGVIKPTFDFIAAIFQVLWGVVSTIFNAMAQIITFVIAPAFNWLYYTAIKPILDLLGAAFTWVWDHTIKPVFDLLSSYITDTVGPTFELAVSALGTIWDGLLDLMRTPIRLAIEYVINKGLIGSFNWLAGKIPGMTKLDEVAIPDALQPGGKAPAKTKSGGGVFADGGIIPGYSPGRDNHHFVSDTGLTLDLAGGEPVLRPEAGAVLGGGWVHGINKAARMGGVTGVKSFLGGFANGGIIGKMKAGRAGGLGDIGDALSDAWGSATSAIKSAAGTAADFIKDPAAMLRTVVEDAVALLPGFTGPLAEAATGVALMPIDAIDKMIRSLLGDDALPDATPRWKPSAGSADAASGIGMGYQAQVAAITKAFPGIGITSTYRPGAVTAVGTKSMHGLGRAIDIAPKMTAFDWIASNYPNSRELIHTPAGAKQLYNGKSFTGWAPVTKSMHYNHIHWAMANGGIVPDLYDGGGDLPPGLSMVANKTGKPESIVTDKMIGDIHNAIERNSSTSTGYTFTGPLGPTARAIAQEVEDIRRRNQAAYGLSGMGAMVQ